MTLEKLKKQGILGSSLIPRVGLGCMGMSEFYGANDENKNLEILDKAVEIGYRHFDTADMYGMGHNEELLGKFIKSHNRQDLFIASKFGIKRDPGDGLSRVVDGSRKYIREAIYKSLDRLGVDYLDLYYVHRKDLSTPIEETVSALSELVSEGLIKGIGLCEVSMETYSKALSVHPIAAVQTEYSLLSKDPEDGILQMCKANNTAFVAYSPMSRGLLTGELTAETIKREGDARQYLPRFSDENIQKNLALISSLKELALAKNCTLAQIALSWVLHQDEHIHIIPGTRREKYLIDNFASLEVSLSKQELTELQSHFSDESVSGGRYPEAAMTGINK